MRHRILILLAAVALAVTFAACGNDESREDADDVGNGQIEKSAPSVIAFNNHFPNVEIKCDGYGDLLLVVTHDDQKTPAITVLPGHPACTGPGKSFNDLLETDQAGMRAVDPPTDRSLYPSGAAVAP